MKAETDWKLLACVALGIAVTLLLLPPIKSPFDDSHLFAVVIVLVRVTLGTVLGVYGYLILFDVQKSR
jgi:hypothetical protein